MNEISIAGFHFRDTHPNVRIGTASDRYAGWLGQIYSPERYEGSITSRTHRVGKKSFREEVLPVRSVKEYFEHFSVLEIDYTFYRPLLDRDGNPTPNYHLLYRYRSHMNDTDSLLLKVPQLVTARKIRQGNAYVENGTYLSAEFFTKQFYKPAVEILGSTLKGFLFEQEYQRAKERQQNEALAEDLNRFFSLIPDDDRYHVELRTEQYLNARTFEVFEKHGVGQVLSHWTWLPSLKKQFARSGERFLNSGKEAVIRLMTPRGTRYEDAYAQAFPFDKLVEGMMQASMVEETTQVMRKGFEQGKTVNVIINNRSGGNAPLIGHEIVSKYAD